jgi:CRP/FNR family transcriptional regulator
MDSAMSGHDLDSWAAGARVYSNGAKEVANVQETARPNGVASGDLAHRHNISAEPELRERECRALLGILPRAGAATAEHRYEPGDTIRQEGQLGDGLYVLTEGVMKLSSSYSGGKRVILRLLGAWDTFGTLAIGTEAFRQVRAEAMTACAVTKIPKVFVQRAIRTRPEVALKLATLSELRFAQYQELIECLLPRKTEARLANLLLILARRLGKDTRAGTIIAPPLSSKDLAQIVASTQTSVTSALKELRRRQLLAITGGRIVILKPEKLSEITLCGPAVRDNAGEGSLGTARCRYHPYQEVAEKTKFEVPQGWEARRLKTSVSSAVAQGESERGVTA